MNDFYDWKNHPITIAVTQEIKSRHDHLVEELVVQTAVLPQIELAEKAGLIKAYRDFLLITFEDISQESE